MKQLRDYQRLPLDRGIKSNLLNADDRGLGKTVVAIEVARPLMYNMQAPVLVVVPKKLKPQWAEEIEDQDTNGLIVFVDASTPLPQAFTSKKPFWVLTHYEALMRHQKILAKTFWSVIICDEAHRIKNRKAQRSVAIKKLQAYRKIALTGTPYDKNPADIWSILNWLQPKIFKSYWDFFKAHVDYEGELSGPIEINGVKDGARFAKVIAPYVIQRSKQEVAPQLPKKIEQYIPIEMTKAQEALYTRIKEIAETDLILDTGELMLVKNHLGRILRLQQAATDPRLLGTDDNGGKIDWLLEYVDDHPNETLLVFTRFRDTAIRIGNMLGVPVVIGGSVPINYSDYPILVAGIDAAGEGLNLGHIWNTVFMDCHWSSIKMAQAIDRTERDLSATQPRLIMYLQSIDFARQPTIDALVRSALAGKWETIALVNAWLKQAQNGALMLQNGV